MCPNDSEKKYLKNVTTPAAEGRLQDTSVRSGRRVEDLNSSRISGHLVVGDGVRFRWFGMVRLYVTSTENRSSLTSYLYDLSRFYRGRRIHLFLDLVV